MNKLTKTMAMTTAVVLAVGVGLSVLGAPQSASAQGAGCATTISGSGVIDAGSCSVASDQDSSSATTGVGDDQCRSFGGPGDLTATQCN
jgi:hypothetical protein